MTLIFLHANLWFFLCDPSVDLRGGSSCVAAAAAAKVMPHRTEASWPPALQAASTAPVFLLAGQDSALPLGAAGVLSLPELCHAACQGTSHKEGQPGIVRGRLWEASTQGG